MRLALAAALFVVAACGDASPPATTPDPVEIVSQVPLTLSEMPASWQVTPAGDDLASLAQFSAECDVFDLSVVFPGALAVARSESFQGPRDQQAQSFAAMYSSDATAQAAIDGTHEIVDRCGDEFKEALKNAAEDQLEALGISIRFLGHVNVSLERNDAPIGDGSAGYRVAVEVNAIGTSESFTVDYLILRSGNVVAASQYATLGDINEVEQQLITQALLASAESAGLG